MAQETSYSLIPNQIASMTLVMLLTILVALQTLGTCTRSNCPSQTRIDLEGSDDAEKTIVDVAPSEEGQENTIVDVSPSEEGRENTIVNVDASEEGQASGDAVPQPEIQASPESPLTLWARGPADVAGNGEVLPSPVFLPSPPLDATPPRRHDIPPLSTWYGITAAERRAFEGQRSPGLSVLSSEERRGYLSPPGNFNPLQTHLEGTPRSSHQAATVSAPRTPQTRQRSEASGPSGPVARRLRVSSGGPGASPATTTCDQLSPHFTPTMLSNSSTPPVGERLTEENLRAFNGERTQAEPEPEPGSQAQPSDVQQLEPESQDPPAQANGKGGAVLVWNLSSFPFHVGGGKWPPHSSNSPRGVGNGGQMETWGGYSPPPYFPTPEMETWGGTDPEP